MDLIDSLALVGAITGTVGAVTGPWALLHEVGQTRRKLKITFYVRAHKFNNREYTCPVFCADIVNQGVPISIKAVRFVLLNGYPYDISWGQGETFPIRLEKYEGLDFEHFGNDEMTGFSEVQSVSVLTSCGIERKAPRRVVRLWNRDIVAWRKAEAERATQQASSQG